MKIDRKVMGKLSPLVAMRSVKYLTTKVKSGIVPFGWCEDNNRAIPHNKEIVAKVQTEEQRNFLLEKLNNKYVRSLRRNYV